MFLVLFAFVIVLHKSNTLHLPILFMSTSTESDPNEKEKEIPLLPSPSEHIEGSTEY
jgi:hypothetical protein